MEEPAAVILAAGRGTRMKSDLPKVLHPLSGRPMISYVVEALRRAGAGRPLLVVGRDAAGVRSALGRDVEYVVQRRPLGTGHAVAQALPHLGGRGLTYVMYADMPFVSPTTLRALRRAMRGSAAAAIATGVAEETHFFGRIVRNDRARFVRIVEDKDATSEERAIKEVNVGVYCFRVRALARALRRVRPNNRQREYYLTDAVTLLAGEGGGVVTVGVRDRVETIGVNSREELSEADRIMRNRILSRLMSSGVTVVDPASTFIDASVRIGRDTVIHPCSILTGRTVVGPQSIIGPGARMHDSVLGRRAYVRDSSLEGARVGDGSFVGPYAHLRPGTVVGRDDRAAQRMHEARAPLRAESGAARALRFGHPLVVLHVLGDGELPGLARLHLAIDPLQQAPALGQVGASGVADVVGGIEAQPVATMLLQPEQGIVAQELTHLATAVIGARIAPRGATAPVVVEVDAAGAVLAPAVELP